LTPVRPIIVDADFKYGEHEDENFTTSFFKPEDLFKEFKRIHD
jgi:hypothetical protein